MLLGFSSYGPKNRLECPRNCGRSYKWRSHLSTHLRLECGVPKQFQCHSCKKRFTRNSTLTKHLYSAHGIFVE